MSSKDSPLKGPIRILSVDDDALLREGIAALVNAESDMKLVAEACNGQEAIERFRSNRPDVTLMDLQMPALNGIEAIIGIRSEFPNARIIVLTTYAGDVQVLRALKAGARGYILTGHDPPCPCRPKANPPGGRRRAGRARRGRGLDVTRD